MKYRLENVIHIQKTNQQYPKLFYFNEIDFLVILESLILGHTKIIRIFILYKCFILITLRF